jgi:hypothetical protein
MVMTEKLYLISEAASYLRMPIPSFRQHRPAIGGAKIGKRWVFTESELLRFVEKHRSKPIHELKTV